MQWIHKIYSLRMFIGMDDKKRKIIIIASKKNILYLIQNF
jgi:hypothetical protein